MMIGLLVLLAMADVALLVAILRLGRRQDAYQHLISEMTEERALLSDLRSTIREDLSAAQGQVRAMKEQVQVLATEAEQEVKTGIETIGREVDGIVTQLSARFEKPLREIAEKQHYAENLLHRVQVERKAFSRVADRAASLARFFKEGAAFSEVMQDLEDKKYADIRALFAQGMTPPKIATELGISEQEVRLVASVHSRGGETKSP